MTRIINPAGQVVKILNTTGDSKAAQEYINSHNISSNDLAEVMSSAIWSGYGLVGSDGKLTDIDESNMTPAQREEQAIGIYKTGVDTSPLSADKIDYQNNKAVARTDEDGNIIGYSTVNGAMKGMHTKAIYYDYDANGNFIGAHGNQETYQGHNYTPTYDASGNLSYQPVPVSHSGGNFFSDMLSALGPLAPIAIAVFAPELLPSLGAFAVPAATAGISILAGEDPTTALEKAGLSYVGGQVAGGVSSGLTDTLGSTAAKVVGNVAGQEVVSGGKIDPVQALISGGLTVGTNAVLKEIPGFDSLDPKTQTAVSKAVTHTLQTGNLSPGDLVNAAIAAGTSIAANSTNTPTESQVAQNNQNLVETLAPYEQSADTSISVPSTESATANDIVDVFTGGQTEPATSSATAPADVVKQLTDAGLTSTTEQPHDIISGAQDTVIGGQANAPEAAFVSTPQQIADRFKFYFGREGTPEELAKYAGTTSENLAPTLIADWNALHPKASETQGTGNWTQVASTGSSGQGTTPSNQDTVTGGTGGNGATTVEDADTLRRRHEEFAKYLDYITSHHEAKPDFNVQDLGISQENIDSFNKNLQGIWDKGGFTSQWQTSGSDRIMVQEDGTAIGINENGESYALTPEQVRAMINNGQLNTAASGYVAATGGAGNTPGGSGGTTTGTTTGGTGTSGTGTTNSGTRTTTTPATTPTSNAAAAAAAGYMPTIGDVAHIKWENGLFGVLPWEEQLAPSAEKKDHGKNSSEDDAVAALENSQYATGGHVDDFDVDALLQILRS